MDECELLTWKRKMRLTIRLSIEISGVDNRNWTAVLDYNFRVEGQNLLVTCDQEAGAPPARRLYSWRVV